MFSVDSSGKLHLVSVCSGRETAIMSVDRVESGID